MQHNFLQYWYHYPSKPGENQENSYNSGKPLRRSANEKEKARHRQEGASE
jgi:hypothetical protein